MGEALRGNEGTCPPHDWPEDAPPVGQKPGGFGTRPDPQAGRGFGQKRVVKSWVCKKCGETVESDIRPSRDFDSAEEQDEDED